MSHRHLLTAVAALFLCVLWTPAARARPFRVNEIPNGNVNTCYNCHSQYGGFTAFGNDLYSNYGVNYYSADVPWPQVYDVDSDGDGQTNGQELGDPCGTWTPGTTPQYTSNISLPGDATSTNQIPACGSSGGTDGGTGGGTDGGSGGGTDGGTGNGSGGGVNGAQGGCATSAGGSSSAAVALLLVGLGLLVVRRRSA